MAAVPRTSHFCGNLPTNQTFTADDINSKWTFVRNVSNQCYANYLYLWPHIVAPVAMLLALLYMKTWGRVDRSPNYGKLFQLTFPLQSLRCVIMLSLALVQMGNFGEGIVTDMEFQSLLPTQPQLYVPVLMAMLSTLMSMYFYQQLEVWNKPSGLGLLLLYWIWSAFAETIRFISLRKNDDFSFDVMRVCLCCTLATIYIILIVIESYVYIFQSRFGRNNLLKDLSEDLIGDNCRYVDDYATFYSNQLLYWLKPLFQLGKKRALELSDLGSIPARYKSKELYGQMEYEIQKQQEMSRKQGIESASTALYPVLMNIYGWRIALVIVMRIMVSFSFVVSASILKQLIKYVTNIRADGGQMMTHDVTVGEFFQNGFILAGLLGIVGFGLANVFNTSLQMLVQIAIPARSALQAVVYQKAMRLSTSSLLDTDMNKGKISNLISVDPNQVLTALIWFPVIFGTPSIVIFNTIALLKELGPSAILALSMYVITVPLQGLILSAYAKVRGSSMVKADDRLKVTNETLQGIKVVKLFGWEDIFLNKIKDTRKEQVKELRKGVFFGGLLIPAGTLGGTLANIVALGLYSVFNNGTPLTPDVAFPALILLSGIIGQIVTLPPALKLCVNGNISIRRLEKFLSAPEIENDVQGRDNFASVMKLSRAQREAVSSFESEPLLEPQYGTFQYTPLPEEELVEIGQKQREEESLAASIAGDVAIEIKDGTFSWNTEHGTPTLLEVNLQIPAGKLTMIIGEVGSGKSSLISAMLGEMQILRGEVIWNKKMNSAAFADQRAWLQNATLKQNVIFGNYEGEKRYNDVITCCALAPDIAILPAGDETEIGEKGINLSGGQKQRINVGRALYSKSDVVILDDPLSALDSHVGAQVFQDGIKLWLGGENRTVILVTHQLKYIEKADNIIVMKDGTILTQGSPAQIKKSDPTLWSLWQGMINAEVNEEEEQQQEAEQKKTEERVRLIRQISEHAKEERYRRLSSVSSVEGLEDVPVSDLAELTSKALEEEDNPNRGRLIQMEERQTGSIPWKTYFNFLAKAGVFSVALTIITNVVVLFTGVFGQYWISLWSQSGQDAIDEGDLSSYSNGFYTGFYSLISFTALFANLVGGLSVYWSVLTAGVKFHDNSITSVLRSPLRFFDTTPSGRIMNRFSADLDKIDQELGLQISIFIMTFLYVVGGVLVNALVAQFFFVLLLPFFFFFLYVTQYYLTSTREMKRLESISLSPVYNHFSETLSGLPTIRAYGYQAQFSEESFRRIDRSALVGLFRTMSNVWLTIQLALLSNLLFMVIGILLLILSKGGAILAGSVGLALSSMLNACTQFSTIVSNAAEIEMSMNAVERLDYYDDLPSEEYDGIVDPPSIWPDQGEIVLDRIWVRYDQDLDPVLKNVSLTFKPEEKIGICGRTGSGKSSMTLSLFKIIDIFSGYIYIDGMNIKHIPLTKLRRKLSIVPQDPVLFNGSIRFNLDPLSEMTDEKLWEAIEIAQLKNVVAKLNGGLDAEVSEGGENFSVGQRQLFCLARAFLRDTKILIMDEATASIDMETDAILQKIVATAFHKRTVLTIAHRTATILDSDRVIVLDNGRVAENDTPGRLLQKDSIFASLVNQNK